MKKLLQLNVTANWGSTGKIAEGIGRAAMSCGWESYVAYGRMMNPSQSILIKVGDDMAVYKHYAKARFLDGEGWGSKTPTKKLIKKIDELRPDIIHMHNIHDHWLNYKALFDYLHSIDTPVVWTFHDCWAFTGGCTYFEVPPCDKWQIQCEDCPQRKMGIDNSLRQFNLRKEMMASLGGRLTIVPVSKWLEEFCHKSILSSSRIQLIHNGVDVSRFGIGEDKDSNAFMILGVANKWDYRKGLDDFVKLRELLPEKFEIILVGLSNQQIRKLPSGISGITKTQNIDELVNLYNKASVLVNPTYADNFPTVNLEALACGTPVITYCTGGSPEAIDSRTGIVVDKGDVEGLANAIVRIKENPEQFLAAACRERAEMHFNQDIQFGKYVDLYESLLAER